MAQRVSEFRSAISAQDIQRLERQSRRENLGRSWYKFSRNPLSIVGGATVLIVVLLAVFAPYVVPYPEHATKPFTDFANASQPPSRAVSLRHRRDRPRYPEPDSLRISLLADDGRSGAGPGRARWRAAGSDRRLLSGHVDRHGHHAHHRHLPGRAAADPGSGHRLCARAQPVQFA